MEHEPSTPAADEYQRRATDPAAARKSADQITGEVRGGTGIDGNGKKADELSTLDKVKGVVNDALDHISPSDPERM